MDSENLSSLIQFAVSDGQLTDSSKVVSVSGLKTKTSYKIRIMSEKGYIITILL